jgi:WxcM-like, C-terminal
VSEMSIETASADDGCRTGPALRRLATLADDRGTLMVADAGQEMAFRAERFFLICDVPAGAVRARHAHRRCRQLLCCIAGACTVETLGETGRAVTRLDGPHIALDVPPWTWVECRDFTPEGRLLVLCSTPYDPADLVDDLGEFQAELSRRR